jgi:hypothetical protein
MVIKLVGIYSEREDRNLLDRSSYYTAWSSTGRPPLDESPYEAYWFAEGDGSEAVGLEQGDLGQVVQHRLRTDAQFLVTPVGCIANPDRTAGAADRPGPGSPGLVGGTAGTDVRAEPAGEVRPQASEATPPAGSWVAMLASVPIDAGEDVDALLAEWQSRGFAGAVVIDSRRYDGLGDPFWVLAVEGFGNEADAIDQCSFILGEPPFSFFDECLVRQL